MSYETRCPSCGWNTFYQGAGTCSNHNCNYSRDPVDCKSDGCKSKTQKPSHLFGFCEPCETARGRAYDRYVTRPPSGWFGDGGDDDNED